MTRHLFSAYAAVLLLAGSASAQQKATITGVPEIPFTSVPNFLKLPAGESLGESVAVATNSKGNIFVYHRRDTTRLFEFDKTGTFIREIGKGYYGFEWEKGWHPEIEEPEVAFPHFVETIGAYLSS